MMVEEVFVNQQSEGDDGAPNWGDYLTGNRPGRLLVVSNFLTKYRLHLLPDAADLEAKDVGAISSRDLEDALEYRALLESLAEAETDSFVVEKYGTNDAQLLHISRRLMTHKQEQIDSLRGKTDAVADRTKIIHLLLERLEVWSTKYLSHDFLLASTKLLPEKARAQTEQCCFSPLLNLPASAYFSSRMPVVSVDKEQSLDPFSKRDADPMKLSAFHRPNKQINCCTLALPPNRHTWRAYARISSMVSLLESPKHLEQAIMSPFSQCELLKLKKGDRRAAYALDYSFTPPDLLALWVRAQWNSQALRHLCMLFELHPSKNMLEPTDGKGSIDAEDTPAEIRKGSYEAVLGASNPGFGKHSIAAGKENQNYALETTRYNARATIDGNADGSGLEAASFRAVFRGNPLRAKYRVVDVGHGVDQLVEWAVVNQSLYTYSRIKRSLLTEPQRKCYQKRKRLRELYSHSHAKRVRREVNVEKCLNELQKACLSFILRWFARRNRMILSILFSANPESLELDIGCSVDPRVLSKLRDLENVDVHALFCQRFTQCSSGVAYAQDRNFACIERHLFATGRYDCSSTVTFRSHMLALLDAFISACPENQLNPRILAGVREDFIVLHDHFLPPGENDVQKTAASLSTLTTGITEDLTSSLKALPSPWVRTCCVCKTGDPKKRNLKTCRNCEHVFHEKCSPGFSTVSFKESFESFPSLLDICKLKKPAHIQRPIFLMSDSVEWTKEEITFERRIQENGCVEPFGVAFQQLNECRTAFDRLDSDSASLLDLVFLENTNTMKSKLVVPLAVENLGCLVTTVHAGMVGARFGLRQGDIITRLVLLECIREDDKKKYESQVFEMCKISHDERMTLLKVQSSRVNISVLRPSVNIVDAAVEWYNGIRKVNAEMLEAFRRHSGIWYCGSCTGQADVEPGESNRIFREAQYCRTVIRRLGMEAYSLPFTDEERRDDDGHFSLRRLDSMMTHIMYTHSQDKTFEPASESFLTPPTNHTRRERLPWAPKDLESRPMELLCRAMKVAMTIPLPEVSDLNTLRSALLMHFMVAFTSWCVGATIKSHSFKGTKGPLQPMKHLRPPWIGDSCSVCFSRVISGDEMICNSEYCRNCTHKIETRIEDISDEEVCNVENNIDEYSRLASMVGTSILVLPTDPLVKSVSDQVHVDHQDRPVEFIVASYLPPCFHEEATRNRPKDAYDHFDECDGIFHLLPVVNADQQIFLLERAKMRGETKGNSSGKGWISLDVLDLEGVARLSPAALQKKIEESNAMRIAIETTIEQKLFQMHQPAHSSTVINENESLNDEEESFQPSGSKDGNLSIQVRVLDSLLKGKASAHLTRSLISTESDLENDQSSEFNGDTSTMDYLANCPEHITVHEVVGSSFQPGQSIVLNPVVTPLRILPLEGDSGGLVYYSDLQYDSETGRRDLQKMLTPQILLRIERRVTDESASLIVLSPKKDSIGWGLEIVRWENESCLRIGRVHKHGAAYKAGLRSHDRIETVNGMKVGQFVSQSEFIISILGVRQAKMRTSRMLCLNEISQVVSTIEAAKIGISKVHLVVSRPIWAGSAFGPSVDNYRNGDDHRHAQDSFPDHFDQENQTPIHAETSQISPQHDGNEALVRPSTATNGDEDLIQGTGQPTGAQRINWNLLESESGTPHIVAAGAAGTNSRLESRLVTHIHSTLHLRHPVNKYDFYRPALHGTILTCLEAAVFLQCVITGNHWKLGIRLLMPRYELKTALVQVKTIFGWTLEQITSIPIVSLSTFLHILRLDKKRMDCPRFPETGEFVLSETIKGQLYKYRLPRLPLPIDQIIQRLERVQRGEWALQNQFRQSNPDLIDLQPPQPMRPNAYQHPQQIEHSISQKHGYSGDMHSINNDSSQQTNTDIVDLQPPHPLRPRAYQHSHQCQHSISQKHGYSGDMHSIDNDSCQQTNTDIVDLQPPHPLRPRAYQHSHQSQHSISQKYGYNGNMHSIDNDSPEQTNPDLIDLQPPHPLRHRAYQHSQRIQHSISQKYGYNGDMHSINNDSSQHKSPQQDLRQCQRFEYQNHASPDFANPFEEVQERLFLYDDQTSYLHMHPGNAAGESIPINQSWAIDQSAQRIRGGGDSRSGDLQDPENSDICLLDIPLEEWNGRAVCYDFAAATKDGTEEAYMVGFVQVPKEWNSRSGFIPEKVKVEAHYVSTIGYLERKVEYTLDTDEVYAVDLDSPSAEARVVANIQSYQKGPPLPTVTVPGDTEYDVPDETGPICARATGKEMNQQDNSRPTSPIGAGEVASRVDGEDMIKAMSVEFSKRLADLEVLGALPDGRDLLWIPSDPMKVFIDESSSQQMLETSQREYLHCLQRAQELRSAVIPLRINTSHSYHCVWGCSVAVSSDNGRQSLAFASSDDLQDHYSKVHAATTKVKEVSLGQGTALLQPQDGNAIVDIARGITSAICARLPFLLELVHVGESSLRRAADRHFFKSPTESIINFPCTLDFWNMAGKLMRSSKPQAKSIRSLLHLWTRLGRLFHCDTTGISRLSLHEFCPLTLALPATPELLPNERNRNRRGEPPSSTANLSCTRCHGCRLCSLPFEKYLRYTEWKNGIDCIGKEAHPRRSIGCSLMSEVALTKETSSDGERHIPGHLGPAKLFLLKVARLVPDCVKLTLESMPDCGSDKVDALYSFRVFDGDNFSTWKAFVVEVRTTGMLAQAFVALLASINRKKLPSWWRSGRGGRSTAFMVMSETSLSTLCLHICVLDAALSELLAGSLLGPAVEQNATSNSV